MKRILACAVVVLTACATKPPTTTDLLLGRWACESEPSFGTIKSTITYLPGGKATADMSIAGSGGAMAVEAVGNVEATWKLVEDDAKLEQTISNVTIAGAKLNSQSIDPGMAQAMVGPYLAGQSATSVIEVDKTSLTLTNNDGNVTSCTR